MEGEAGKGGGGACGCGGPARCAVRLCARAPHSMHPPTHTHTRTHNRIRIRMHTLTLAPAAPAGLAVTFLEPCNGLFWVGRIYTNMNQVRARTHAHVCASCVGRVSVHGIGRGVGLGGGAPRACSARTDPPTPRPRWHARHKSHARSRTRSPAPPCAPLPPHAPPCPPAPSQCRTATALPSGASVPWTMCAITPTPAREFVWLFEGGGGGVARGVR